jgi:GTPase
MGSVKRACLHTLVRFPLLASRFYRYAACMFVDKVRIHVKAGDGGNGSVSFRREKYVDRGGPDGGNGGKGGDVVFVADKNVGDLSDYFFHPRLLAKHGGHGRGKNCWGRGASDVMAKVPIGTQVFRLTLPVKELRSSQYRPAAAMEGEADFSSTKMLGLPYREGRAKQALQAKQESEDRVITGGEEDKTALSAEIGGPTTTSRELIADLVEDGQRFVVANGGRGGRGNVVFTSPSHQAPREFEYGEPGEALEVELELKTLADVGLVGFPNAGKSTLISKITHAHPKIAPYPFTTLTPNVGILTYDDHTRIRIADIPGLIEGAHRGKGLGYDFLRHIERCQLLVMLLDMAGADGRKPQDDYRQLLEELELYNPEILKKKRLVVANKTDLPAAKKNLAAFKRKHRVRAIAISALAGEGLEKLKLAIHKLLS